MSTPARERGGIRAPRHVTSDDELALPGKLTTLVGDGDVEDIVAEVRQRQRALWQAKLETL